MVLLVAFIDRLWGDGPNGSLYRQVVGCTCGPTGGLYRQVVGCTYVPVVLLVAFIDRLLSVRTYLWSYWWPFAHDPGYRTLYVRTHSMYRTYVHTYVRTYVHLCSGCTLLYEQM